MGPREVGWIEAALTAITPSGLPVPQRLDVVLAMFALVRSVAVTGTGTQPWTLPGDAGQLLLTRLREHPAQYPALLHASAAFAYDEDGHPHTVPAVGAPDAPAPATAAANNGWRIGLRLLLDGIEANAEPRNRDQPGTADRDETDDQG